MLKRGYNAFSFSDISTRLGVKNAAIHYHYPTKESLGIDILRNEQARFESWKAFGVENKLYHEEQLERFFQIYEESLNLELSICLVGSVASHFMTVSANMQKDLDILVSDMLTWLVGLIDDGRRKQIFHFEGSSDGMAHSIVSSLAGSLQLSRVKGPEFFQSVKRNIRTQLGLKNST